jgi:hypothetical protein
MQAWRSTLILLAFWIVVFVAGGYYVEGHLKAKQKTLEKREAALQEELEYNQRLVAQAVGMQERLEELQESWLYRSKAIPRTETSQKTYEYLDMIVADDESSLNFDFVQISHKDSAGTREVKYKVTGEAKFEDLFTYLWYLEHVLPYIRIESIELEETTVKKSRKSKRTWISFELELNAVSANRPGFEEVDYTIDTSAPDLDFDFFQKPVKDVVRLPANTRGLPNVFESTLQALTPTQVYMIDQNGALKILKMGDEVYLGHLVEILPDDNRVDFYLSQLIPPRKISLVIGEK